MKNIISKKLIKDNIQYLGSVRKNDRTEIQLTFYEDIEEGATFLLMGKRENETFCKQVEGITNTGNVITIILSNYFVEVAGVLYLNLTIENADEKITTSKFFLTVDQTIENDIISENQNNIDTLEELEAFILKADTELEEFKTEFFNTEKMLNNFILTTTNNVIKLNDDVTNIHSVILNDLSNLNRETEEAQIQIHNLSTSLIEAIKISRDVNISTANADNINIALKETIIKAEDIYNKLNAIINK